MRSHRTATTIAATLVFSSFFLACSSDSAGTGSGGSSNNGGSATGANAGQGGDSGQGGSGGSEGGTAGVSGNSGSSGSSGNSGNAGDAGSAGNSGSSGASGSAGSAGGNNVDTACEDFANALCDRYYSCDTYWVTFSYLDSADCKTRGKAICLSESGLDGLAPDYVSQLNTCASAFSSAACNDLVSGVQICQIQGQRPIGDPCATASQCASAYCTYSIDSCGSCQNRVAVGQTCDPASSVCESGSICNYSTMQCTAYKQKGQSCSAAGDMCAPPSVCYSNTCVDPLTEGQSCGANAPGCDSTKGLYCNPISASCEVYTIHSAGQSCTYDTNTGELSLCGADSVCNSSQVCDARKQDGQACTTSTQCRVGSHCVNSTCQLAYPACL